MIKNFLRIFLFAILIVSCGYSPMYSKKNLGSFSIQKLTLDGDSDVNKIIKNKLRRYIKQSDENVVLSANTRVKLGGMVKKDSFFINENKVNFEVTDFEDSIKVIYEGLLPDLFKEGKGIVVLGKYIDGIFYADEVFAKHDENYMPPNLELD